MVTTSSLPAVTLTAGLSKVSGAMTLTVMLPVCLFLSVTMIVVFPSLTPVTVIMFLSALAVAILSSVSLTDKGRVAWLTVTVAVPPVATLTVVALKRMGLSLSSSLWHEANVILLRQQAANTIVLKTFLSSIVLFF